MNYIDFEEMLKSEDGMVKFIDEITPYLNEVDSCRNKHLYVNIDNPIDCRETLNKVTGLLMLLKPIQTIVESYIDNVENNFFVYLEKENKDKRFYGNVAEKKAKNNTKYQRRILSILNGYISSLEDSKITCQSILKSFDYEK